MRPHAVASIAGTVNGVTNPSYTYDANGNMTAGAGRSVAYTAFNMASAITQGSTTTNFWYDPEHNRVRMYVSGVYVQGYDSDPVSGAMEEYRIAGSTTTWSDYIKADGQLVAMRSCTGGPPCTSGGTWTYFVTDELGTVVRATDSTGDPSSAHTERNAYDPWGRHRNMSGTDDATCGATPASKTTRGYTGHEQLNDLCLVNANARIYDPTVARFMTPDSMVSDAMNVQDWNAYTYVNNRPLTLTDPTGHEPDPGANKAPTSSQRDALNEQQKMHDEEENNPSLQIIAGDGMAGQLKLAGEAVSALNSMASAAIKGDKQAQANFQALMNSGAIDGGVPVIAISDYRGPGSLPGRHSTTVDLRFRHVFDTAAQHGFIVVTDDNNGNQWINQGGPGDPNQVPCARCLGTWKPDQAWTDVYTKTSRGYDDPYTQVASFVTNIAAASVVHNLQAYTAYWNSKGLPYEFPSPNSNTYIAGAWRHLTGSIPALPPSVYAPGYRDMGVVDHWND